MIEAIFGALLIVAGVFGLGFWAGRTSERRWWQMLEHYRARATSVTTDRADSDRYGETI